jgi:excinuclease ABC subunit C
LSRRQRTADIRLSKLIEIPGIGERRANALIREFGGVDGIASASYEELRERAGLPEAVAERVAESFRAAAKPED